MSFKITRFIFFPLFFCLFFFGKASGQGKNDTTVVITDTTNIDVLFKKARDYSRDGNYPQARRICQKILDKNPKYYEVRTFLGRTYAWEKQYDNARTELSRVLIEKENDYEALNALFDVEFWTESYSVANDYLKVALGYYPTSEELLLKKAKLQIKLEDKNEAALTLRRILDLNPGQKEAIKLMNSLEGRKLNNYFQTAATADLYGTRAARQLYVVELGHNFNFGSITLRTNYGDRFNQRGLQYEVESYAHFTKSTYVNVLLGISDVSIFPKTKVIWELYQKLPAGFEMSFGMRFLNYSKLTTVYSGSISNYFKDYWFSVRTFVTPKDTTYILDTLAGEVNSNKTSFSFIVNARTYFGDSDNYLGLKVGSGRSYEEGVPLTVSVNLPSYSCSMELQKHAFGRWTMKCEFTYAKENIKNDRYTERYSTTVTLKTVF